MAEEKVKHRNPFEFMKVSDNQFLNGLSGRSPCIKCNSSRKFFCYSCHLPTVEIQSLLPDVRVSRPQIDSIRSLQTIRLHLIAASSENRHHKASERKGWQKHGNSCSNFGTGRREDLHVSRHTRVR